MDIVERLRHASIQDLINGITDEAADEIERLRKDAKYATQEIIALEAESDSLQKDLLNAKDKWLDINEHEENDCEILVAQMKDETLRLVVSRDDGRYEIDGTEIDVRDDIHKVLRIPDPTPTGNQ